MTENAIGIDLGTTNSCVAIYRNNKVDVIENEMGYRTTPSWVTFTKDVILTGPEAVSEAHKHPKTAIFEAKRLIGQRFLDSKCQEDIQRFPFPVFNDLGSPKIRIELENGDTKEYYPEEISAYILQRMKKIAESRIKDTVTRAVITVPAYFNDAQRQATKDAATIAGFKAVNIINEPTAAALAFDHEYKKQYKRNVLVYDFGGGTFDVSVVKVGRSRCEVKATKGDSHLGGTDIDANLVNYLIENYQEKFCKELDCKNVITARRLKNKCEEAKKALSGEGRFQVDIEIDRLDDVDYIASLTKIRLEHINEKLFAKTIQCVDQCLSDCGLNKDDIDEVVLVGGSSKIPKIQDLLKQYFGSDKINRGVNPDEAVACGAAIYAANILAADKCELTSVEVVDVTSLSIGTEVTGDIMSVLIPCNTPLPAQVITRYQTVYDNQTTMDFRIYQGDNIIASENFELGEFTMTDLTEAPAKKVRVEICCKINTDGILNVTATEVNTVNTKEVQIDVKKTGLSDEQIQERIRDAEINNERAKRRLKFDEEKYSLEILLQKTVQYAEQQESEKQNTILDRHDEVCKWLETARISDLDKIIEINKELLGLINDD